MSKHVTNYKLSLLTFYGFLPNIPIICIMDDVSGNGRHASKPQLPILPCMQLGNFHNQLLNRWCTLLEVTLPSGRQSYIRERSCETVIHLKIKCCPETLRLQFVCFPLENRLAGVGRYRCSKSCNINVSRRIREQK